MGQIKGTEVTEDQIQAWVAEAEEGYSDQVMRRGRKPIGDGPGRVVPVRLDETLLAAVDGKAEHDEVSRSEIIRAALRAYVA